MFSLMWSCLVSSPIKGYDHTRAHPQEKVKTHDRYIHTLSLKIHSLLNGVFMEHHVLSSHSLLGSHHQEEKRDYLKPIWVILSP